ncbi:MAG: hypothetical protein JWQ02_468 [Capsulimonas sp.]|nr:hypothetical protein [Capsulimonas sp.]
MNVKKILFWAAAAMVAVPVARIVWLKRQDGADSDARRGAKFDGKSPYREIVADTLSQHEGEESPMVKAFEEALEQETHLEKQLAQDIGLRSPA